MTDKKDAMAEHVRRAVLTCDFAPGESLDEAALCKQFELSRTPFREVCRDLAGEGYLDVQSARGARVSEMSHKTLRAFFLAAPGIYEAVLRLAAQNATADQIADLRTAQTYFRDALTSGSVASRALANTWFHEITGEMAGNLYLLPSFRRLLIDHARIGMTFYQPQDESSLAKLTQSAAQHDAIIAAIAAGDEAEVAQLAQAHWALSRDEITRYVLPQALDISLDALPQEKSA